MLKAYRALKKKGILSINSRNADLILPNNQRKHYPIVDDKLQTKRLAIKSGIAVPKLYLTVSAEHELKQLPERLKPYDDFVVKPAHGAGGDGIIVVQGRLQHYYRKINGQLLTEDDLLYHLSLTLSGAYSLSGHPDTVIIEQRVVVNEVFSSVSYEGVPDIRIIVYQGFPIMAMVRLPTRSSDGKANLHQGAIGAGVSISHGVTLGGVHQQHTIDLHPDTLNLIADIEVPHWQAILEIASKSYDMTGLGFLGADIVLDKVHGPLMLELNARPGLNIQLANRDGIARRVALVDSFLQTTERPDLDQRLAFSASHF